MSDVEVVEGVVVEESHALVPVAPAPVNLFRTEEPHEIVAKATAVADTLKEVLRQKNLITNIQGRDHVQVEGWTLCGTLLGVYPTITWTRKLDDGWEARAEAVTLAGNVVGSAEAECLRSERNWGNRDDYALRSMAQTRAISKAMRMPLGFIIVMAGFAPAPSDEIPPEAVVTVPNKSGGQQHREDLEAPPANPASDAQLRKLVVQAKERGLDTDEERYSAMSEAVGRRITSSKELTKREASTLIEAWTSGADIEPLPPKTGGGGAGAGTTVPPPTPRKGYEHSPSKCPGHGDWAPAPTKGFEVCGLCGSARKVA